MLRYQNESNYIFACFIDGRVAAAAVSAECFACSPLFQLRDEGMRSDSARWPIWRIRLCSGGFLRRPVSAAADCSYTGSGTPTHSADMGTSAAEKRPCRQRSHFLPLHLGRRRQTATFSALMRRRRIAHIFSLSVYSYFAQNHLNRMQIVTDYECVAGARLVPFPSSSITFHY